MVPRVDLHIHTTASDGRYTPEEIVRMAAERGLKIIAISDHDTVDGIAPALEAARSYPELMVIPAVEISTQAPGNEVHVLGYFIDYKDPGFGTALSDLRDSRLGRAEAMISKLKRLGMDVDWRRVRELAGDGTVGRPHIAQVMMQDGYVSSFQEAFDKYIGQGKPAYVERIKLTPAEAVRLILKVKGLPVLAHPLTIDNHEAMVAELKKAGMVGIEVYYKDFTGEERKRLADLARRYGLIATGGSDYHGIDDSAEVMVGEAGVPLAAAEQLIALADSGR